MQLLIGIDDTDNKQTRGTGYRARYLGKLLQENGLALVEGITRHQLLIDPRVPYTSHNSSACLVVNTNGSSFDAIAGYCRDFLLQESAPGSDAGLCLVPQVAVGSAVQEFGVLAKKEVLTYQSAVDLARREDIFLEGLTGDYVGVIGALAAVGLRAGGQDGRFIWLEGLREISGIYTAGQLVQSYRIDRVMSLDNVVVPPEGKIDVGEWRRPVLKDGQAVLLVERAESREEFGWRVAPKEIVKQY